jgi:predicted anti-sigma-YlaC factor YlaD
VHVPATDCARARESISVQLDGELPQLELDRLETHLRICPDCAEWAEAVRNVTATLREASLEVPHAVGFVASRRSRRWSLSASLALASAAAVVATMFVAPGRHEGSLSWLVAGAAPNTTYDVAAGVVYPARPALGSLPLGATSPIVAPWPVRPL